MLNINKDIEKMYLEVMKNGRAHDSESSDSTGGKTVERQKSKESSKSPSPSRIQSIDFSKATKTPLSNQIYNMVKTPKTGDLSQKIDVISRENQELKSQLRVMMEMQK